MTDEMKFLSNSVNFSPSAVQLFGSYIKKTIILSLFFFQSMDHTQT